MFTVVVDPPGRRAIELTPIADSVQFATAAVGGFGNASFAVEGNQLRLLTHLARIRICYGTATVWHGRIEDPKLRISKDSVQTSVTAFGFQRLLSDNSVRKVWVNRALDWRAGSAGQGVDTGSPGFTPAWPINIAGAVAPWSDSLDVVTGEVDPTDSTKKGVRVRGKAAAVINGGGAGAYIRLPVTGLYLGVTVASSMAAGWTARVFGWNWGNGASGASVDLSAGASINSLTITRDAIAVLLVNTSLGALTPAVTEFVDFTELRVLYKSTEDATGGYYGDTILRDLIALCPGLTEGVIESGSDFTIQAIDRAIRDDCLSAVNEVTGYYTREWAVWEDGRCDWRTPNLDEPQWIVQIGDCDELEIETSIDTLTKTAYILYTDAASGVDAEASAVATSQRNPFVKTGAGKDGITNAGFPMTANTSGQFATLIAASRGKYPPVIGRVVLPVTRLVRNAVGTRQPAALIRAGANLLIGDLPKTDVFAQGRDGETLFHIASTELNMQDGTITLELEGQGREIDVITARLAAATRVLTG